MRDEADKQHYEALGAADDARDPDGLTAFSYAQAQEQARKFFARKARELAGHLEEQNGPYTAASAVSDYFAARERRSSKGARADRYVVEARIPSPTSAISNSAGSQRAAFAIGRVQFRKALSSYDPRRVQSNAQRVTWGSTQKLYGRAGPRQTGSSAY